MRYLVILLLIVIDVSAQEPIYSSEARHHPDIATNGMVASQHPLATQVGLEILRSGGNAVDAAVGVGFALAVVLPRAGNLGGGGFMLVHDAESDQTRAIDYREIAPLKAHRDMFLDEDGEVDTKEFNHSHNSAGVPGTVAGLIHALESYGTMDIREVIAPAISLARHGFPVTHDLQEILIRYKERLQSCPSTQAVFYKSDGCYLAGDTLVQDDLAWSLEQISTRGKAGFYSGPLAERMIKGIQTNNGVMSLADLRKYEVIDTDPVWGSYRGHKIASMPPPSSGGVHLIQMLNILEGYDLDSLEHNSAETIHLMVEAMRLSYADRSEHLGDPRFWSVPVVGITSKAYADSLRSKIVLGQATKSADIKPGNPQDYESEETTHFSVVDKDGNVVSNTYTLNFSFGSGHMAAGTGILLNNEMGDFSAKSGVPNAYGLVGGAANAVAAGKRPLSSMTPTIVFKNDHPYLVTGSPGGSRIITTVLQIILNVIDHKMNIAEATHAPRIHHQWLPDVLFYERYFSPDTRKLLEAKGHSLKSRPAMGSTQSIMIDRNLLLGATDPRRPDGCTLGY